MIKALINHCLKATRSKLNELGVIAKRYASVEEPRFSELRLTLGTPVSLLSKED